VHIEHVRVAGAIPGKTDYMKYDPPWAKQSLDVLAKDTICTLLPLSQKQVVGTVAMGGFLHSPIRKPFQVTGRFLKSSEVSWV
jgi:hypothetical protein